MIEIVINYDPVNKDYKVYEPTTDTLLLSKNLTEALVNLSEFLKISGMIDNNILEYSEISYHIDSYTMKSIIESNVKLIKQIKSGPSGFALSNQRFGGNTGNVLNNNDSKSGSKKHKSGNTPTDFKNFTSSKFSGNSGFSKSAKKFGGK